MGFSNTVKSTSVGLIALIIITGAYIFLVGEKKEKSLLLTDSASAPSSIAGLGASNISNTSELAEVRDVVSILNQFKTISIDGAIFDDLTFRALTDFHREVSTQPKGRDNPFLPGEGVRSSVFEGKVPAGK